MKSTTSTNSTPSATDLDGNGIADDPANDTAYDTDLFPRLPEREYRGYKLGRDLDFNDADSYASGRNDDWVDPADGGTATFGWEPVGTITDVVTGR